MDFLSAHREYFQLIDYNDTKDKADMTEYGASSNGWNIYDLSTFTWNNLSLESDVKDNTVVLKASSGYPTELWQYNGSLSIKVRPNI